MEQLDLGWLAGIFDGEGSISLNFSRKTNMFTHWVAIANKQQGILKHIREVTAAVGNPPTRFNPSNSTLVWSGYEGTQLLQLLTPHLHNTKQLRRALIYCKFCDPTRMYKHNRPLKFQLWEIWKDLVREEWREHQNRGPKPPWVDEE